MALSRAQITDFAGLVNQARGDSFGFEATLSPEPDTADPGAVLIPKASVSGIARRGGLADDGGGFETEFSGVARWAKAPGVVPKKGMYFQLTPGQSGLDVDGDHGAGSWFLIADVLDSSTSGEWRVALETV